MSGLSCHDSLLRLFRGNGSQLPFSRIMKKSTDIRTLKTLNKPQRYSIPNVRGMHLWVRSPDLSKYWIWRFSFLGRRYDMSLGSFPAVSLLQATEKVMKARALLMDGINPITARAAERQANWAKERKKVLFRDFSLQYIESMAPTWSGKRQEQRWTNSISTYAFPVIGALPLEDISTNHIVEILKPIWTTRNETASKLRGRLQRIFSAAITRGLRTTPNPAEFKNHLENILPTIRKQVKHHRALPFQEFPAFFKFLMESGSVSSLCLQFTLLNATRTSETLYAKRKEIVEDIWTIPSSRMKMRIEHQVPLCPRSLEILDQAARLDPDSDYLFSINGRPLSNMAMLMLCRRYQSGLTTHGGRATFRTWVSDATEHSPEVAESALAHSVGDSIAKAYNRGKIIVRRKALMLDWESYCLGKDPMKEQSEQRVMTTQT